MKKTIILILLMTIVVQADFFRDDSKNVVIDKTNKRMWQDSDGWAQHVNWFEAVKYCASLELGGYGDWRLPIYEELDSIVDRSKKKGDVFINDAFKYAEKNDYYWTVTRVIVELKDVRPKVKIGVGTPGQLGESAGFAKSINFRDGFEFTTHLWDDDYVRCMRNINE